jgi:hypothetical protein
VARPYHDQILQADEGCDFAFLADTSAWHVVRSGSCPDYKWRARRAGDGSVLGGRGSRKRKLRRFAAGLRLKVRKGDAHEPNTLGWWEYRSDQTKSQLM